MHEKKRNKKQKKLDRFARGKSKQKQGRRKDGSGSPDSLAEETLRRNGDGVKAVYMEQYRNKKRIETRLDEEHYWSEEEEGLDQFKMEDYDDVIYFLHPFLKVFINESHVNLLILQETRFYRIKLINSSKIIKIKEIIKIAPSPLHIV